MRLGLSGARPLVHNTGRWQPAATSSAHVRGGNTDFTDITDFTDTIHPIDAENSAESVAAHFGHYDLRAWLMRSRHWTTPLHHLATVGADRARALLRGGADLRAAAGGADAPTPLSLAERLRAEGSAPAGSAADLVLRAAEPWSPQTHQLFPSEARARAVELMLLGARFSREDRSAIGDVWMAFVVPHAVARDY